MKEKYIAEIFVDSSSFFSKKELDQLEDLVGEEIGFCFDLIDNPDRKHVVIICNVLLDPDVDLEAIHKSLADSIEKKFPRKKIKLQTRWTIVDALPSITLKTCS